MLRYRRVLAFAFIKTPVDWDLMLGACMYMRYNRMDHDIKTKLAWSDFLYVSSK